VSIDLLFVYIGVVAKEFYHYSYESKVLEIAGLSTIEANIGVLREFMTESSSAVNDLIIYC
jgi:hypothetical protein